MSKARIPSIEKPEHLNVSSEKENDVEIETIARPEVPERSEDEALTEVRERIQANDTGIADPDWRKRAAKTWVHYEFDETDFRVPVKESPTEIIAAIDPNLEYTEQLGVGTSMSNQIFVVRDKHDGIEKILKVISAPAHFSEGLTEHRIYELLNKTPIAGIPKVYTFYNSLGETRDSNKFTALLREKIDGDTFNAKLRGKETYDKLERLIRELNNVGVNAPRDLNNWNILVDHTGQPYIADFEESSFGSGDFGFETKKSPTWYWMKNIFFYNVCEHLSKSKNPILRIASKNQTLVKIIATLFYDGPR
jgi:predicted Ser/Thr protein kinase